MSWLFLFFGTPADTTGDEYAEEIARNYRALVPEHKANFETIEGFVFGWSLMALALDMDPAIDWRRVIAHRFLCSELDALVALPPEPSRLVLQLARAEALTTFGPNAHAHLWLIPVFIEATPGGRKLRLLPAKIADGPQELVQGRVDDWQLACEWDAPRPRPDDLVFLMIVGFDAIELVKDLPAEPGEPAGVEISYLTADDDLEYAIDKFLRGTGVVAPEDSFEAWENFVPQLWDEAARRLGRRRQLALTGSYHDTYVGASVSGPMTAEPTPPFEVTLCSPEGEPYTGYRICGSMFWKGGS